LVLGEQQLAAFRAFWDGARLLNLVATSGGQVFIGWPIGVGKSFAIDKMIATAIASDRYDLVVALFPTRRVLEEREWIRNPPASVRVVALRPRPRERCGNLDAPWRHFEAAGMAALGKAELCSRCSRRAGCYWPRQYGIHLRGAQAIYATHAHLGRVPDFAAQLAGWAGADRVLTLLDEVSFAMTSFRRRVKRRDLELFADVLNSMPHGANAPLYRDWGYLTRLLLRAATTDLRSTEWRMPPSWPSWALAVQASGWATHGEQFRFIAYDLQQFGRSPLESRERHTNGDLSFAAPPAIGWDFAVFSGTALPKFLRFRLGQELANPFAGHRFDHPGTRWYNIASRIGMRGHFPRNADQVLDFFAGLVSRRLLEGRRPLLIAKKRFVRLCDRLLVQTLAKIHPMPVRIATGNWEAVDLAAPDIVPLVHFGLIGTNLFENFDAAFALTGFYVNAKIVDAILQDVLGSDGQIPIVVRTEGSPRRRRARVADPRHRSYDVNNLAQFALDQQELDVVLQAVGRVRPYTRPREIVTLQCAAHPQRPYDREFGSLAEAREYFGIPSRRERDRDRNRRWVQEARRAGLTQAEAAASLGLGIMTVKRHWNTTPPGGTAGPS
jgi:hypothetical protein